MKRSFYFISIALIVVLFLLSAIATKKTYAQSSAIKITDVVPATAQTGVIFQTSLTVNYSAGRMILAGDEQGTGRMFVDDNLYIDITRPDGTTLNYTHFLDFNYSPVDLTNYFQVGTNKVNVRIENTGSQGEASPYWLVNVPDAAANLPFQITDAIPTLPFKTAGSYFGKYFYVDYNGTGRLILSSAADGRGLMQVDDTLYVQITKPDGISNVYAHFKGTFSAADLTVYFATGRNLVHLWLENTDTNGGSSAFWLTDLQSSAVTLPFEVTSLIPAVPTQGDFLGRYFYVNYSGNNSLWLAADNTSQGDVSINGTLYLQVIGPDGYQRTYTHFGGTFAPVDVSNYFVAGLNLVHVRLEQLSGTSQSNSLYLTERVSPPPSISTTPPGWQIKITDSIPSGTAEFFNKTFDVDYREGIVMLSAYADGTGQMSIDDNVYVTVTRPDGTQTLYTHNFGFFAPIELTKYFKIGTNRVQVRMVNTGGPGNSSGYWLVNIPETPVSFPAKITDAVVSNNGDLLTKHFYIDYQGNGSILLSLYADGTGNMNIDDDLYINITHPDSTKVIYHHGIGHFSPRDLTTYFDIGINLVEIQMVNTQGGGVASSYWLSYASTTPQSFPIKITDAINPISDHEFFRRFFYVDYRGGDISLSSNADGSGQLYIDDDFYVTVVHADRSQSTYWHGIGSFASQKLTPYFNLGINWVDVRMYNTAGGGKASPFWFSYTGPSVLPTPIPPTAVPTTPVPTVVPTTPAPPTVVPTTAVLTPIPTTPVPPTVTPAITEIRPNQGSADVPNEINIYGANFADGAIASLGSTALATTYVNAIQLQAIVPAGLASGVYDLIVANSDGGRATLVHAYTVIDPTNNDDLFGLDYELWTDPVAPHANAATKVGLTVHRLGGKQTLSNVVVRFYLGDPSAGGIPIGDGAIPLLSPRAAQNASVTWTPPTAKEYTIYAVIDPANVVAETYEDNNVVHHTITVLSPAPDQVAPHVDSFTINSGSLATVDRTVKLNTTASDPQSSIGVKALLFVEYAYSQAANQWVPAQTSGWLHYATTHTNYDWQLLPATGMKYLQAWAADGAGNVSLFPFKAYINYLPSTYRVGQNQGQIYRYKLNAGQQLTARVEPVSGDPDLYLWAPDYATRPPWISNLRIGVDDVSMVAPVDGVYQIEVYGFSVAEYRLSVDVTALATAAQVVGGQDPTKSTPSQPLVPISNEPGAQLSLPTPGQTQQTVFLPLIRR